MFASPVFGKNDVRERTRVYVFKFIICEQYTNATRFCKMERECDQERFSDY